MFMLYFTAVGLSYVFSLFMQDGVGPENQGCFGALHRDGEEEEGEGVSRCLLPPPVQNVLLKLVVFLRSNHVPLDDKI